MLDRNKKKERERGRERENGPTQLATNITGQLDFHAIVLKFQPVHTVKPTSATHKQTPCRWPLTDHINPFNLQLLLFILNVLTLGIVPGLQSVSCLTIHFLLRSELSVYIVCSRFRAVTS